MANQVSIALGSVVVASKQQVSTDLGNEVVIMDVKGGAYLGLNAVGARIWSLVQQPRTVQEVRDVILREYHVEPSRCERDVLAVLGQLASRGLVEVAAPAPRAIPA